MMRITNSMMTANTKANINTNKVNADKLNTMTASGQKITRPSDDPVVAIRAMRLNTSLTELEQYYGKNIPDADAWFTDTETALTQTDEVLSSIREKLNQASSQENVTSNVKDILEELKQLKDQVYAIGNADSAGRTVFTGYRTGEMLTFMEQDTINYEITETFTKDDLETFKYVKGTASINDSGQAFIGSTVFDGTSDSLTFNEEKVEEVTAYRIRLSYDNLDKFNSITVGSTTISVTETPISGLYQDAIDKIYTPTSGANFINETGELILSKSAYDTLIQASGISINYEKSDWQKGDLRPEHYFMCSTPKVDTDPRTYSATYPGGIEYNYNRLDAAGNPVTSGGDIKGFIEQDLSYEIAFNQTIVINTHASDVYSHDIGRDIDELIKVTQQMVNAEDKVSRLQNLIDNTTDETELQKLNVTMGALNKEAALVKEKMHSMYTSAITAFKGYSDDVNKQIANLGALTARLEMTKNRVKDQKSNVKELADQNINCDLSETAIDLKNAELALEAAQLAAGKIAQQTLLNYI
ncbi:MAG: hypothetical protein SPF36_00840 [Lachnospiraceae bacterium]|nr:hypothetical protein [Lachnospiraceae bacterium]MDY5639630.1 hypothetical protein [Lachnospiraceae bacterium]